MTKRCTLTLILLLLQMKQVYKTFNPPLPLTERPQFGRMMFNGEIEVQSHHKDGKWKRRFGFLHQQVLILCKCDGEVNYVREILDVDKLVVGRVKSTDNVEKYTNRFMLIAAATRTPMAARTTTSTPPPTTKTSPTETTKKTKLETEASKSTALTQDRVEEKKAKTAPTIIKATATATENGGFESDTETTTTEATTTETTTTETTETITTKTTTTDSTTTETTENDGTEQETQPQTETIMVQTRRAVAWIEALERCISVVVRNEACISCKSSNMLKLTTFDEGESCNACGMLFLGLISQGYRCSNCNFQTHRYCLTHCTDLDADDV